MKRIIILSIVFLGWINLSAQTLQPYIIGFESTKNISDVKLDLIKNLSDRGFHIVGEYMPANDKSRYVIVVTHPKLLKSVEMVSGLSGFAATLRVGLTRSGDMTIVSYTNPIYWGNAYYRNDFDRVASHYTQITKDFDEAMKGIGTYKNEGFGSEKGLTVEKLRKYHYMLGMPYFDDVVDLAEFDDNEKALKRIDSNLKNGVPNVKLIYKLSIPNTSLTLYGFALSGEDGEASFLPKIDIDVPKHTAFLPYEMLLNDKEVVMLHGRFRIAISFPDLTMGTFTKIMSTPGNIEDMLEEVAK